jgi:hypothetical protein
LEVIFSLPSGLSGWAKMSGRKNDTLLKLSDVKGTDGKVTLLHFVVQVIIRSQGNRATGATKEQDRSVPSVDALGHKKSTTSVVWMVRARVEQIKVSSFLLCLLTKFTELARDFVCNGFSPSSIKTEEYDRFNQSIESLVNTNYIYS